MKILIIEDEQHLSDALKQLLEKENFITDVCNDGEIGLDYALTDVYDLILLDIMLPKMDGLSLLKELREANVNTKVLLLTARDQIEDRVKGLNLGADDYLTKPFAFEELLARVKALLRRHGDLLEAEGIMFNDLRLDYNALILYKDEKSINLTLKESEILQMLMMRKQMKTPKELLIEKLWGYDSEAEDNNVEVYISFLRKKLKFLKCNTQIKTTRGVGYSLEAIDV